MGELFGDMTEVLIIYVGTDKEGIIKFNVIIMNVAY